MPHGGSRQLLKAKADLLEVIVVGNHVRQSQITHNDAPGLSSDVQKRTLAADLCPYRPPRAKSLIGLHQGRIEIIGDIVEPVGEGLWEAIVSSKSLSGPPWPLPLRLQRLSWITGPPSPLRLRARSLSRRTVCRDRPGAARRTCAAARGLALVWNATSPRFATTRLCGANRAGERSTLKFGRTRIRRAHQN